MMPGLYTGPAFAGLRIGLLGGSFNPAHEGHLHLSLLALRHLRLDQVWWLVSPQNPLKPIQGMAPFAVRHASAVEAAAGHPRIKVTGIEHFLSTRYTADTLAVLHQRYRRTHFVWLMGADNLGQIHRWERWRSIFADTPVAVFDRPPYGFRMLATPAPQAFARARMVPSRAGRLAQMAPPSWIFFPTRREAASSTEIRASATSSELPPVARKPRTAYVQM